MKDSHQELQWGLIQYPWQVLSIKIWVFLRDNIKYYWKIALFHGQNRSSSWRTAAMLSLVKLTGLQWNEMEMKSLCFGVDNCPYFAGCTETEEKVGLGGKYKSSCKARSWRLTLQDKSNCRSLKSEKCLRLKYRSLYCLNSTCCSNNV